MTRNASLPALALLLVACGQPSSAPTQANADDADAAIEAGQNASTASNDMPPFAEPEGAQPTAPEPAPIPSKFRGTWAETKALCANPGHRSRLVISGRTVRFPDFVIIGESFTFPTANQFALKGKVETTGTPAEAHYSINAAGDVLTDEAGGGAVRVRCG